MWARIGWINRRIGEWDEAINYLEKRLQLNPRGVESYADLGETFRTVGDYNNAVKYFSKAVEISPSHVISYVNLSEVLYYELDDKKTAIEALERDLVWSDNDSKKNPLAKYPDIFTCCNLKKQETMKEKVLTDYKNKYGLQPQDHSDSVKYLIKQQNMENKQKIN